MEITTNTIAELYIKQGYPEKAVDIYKAILELDPANSAATEKIQKLEAEVRGEIESITPSVEPVAAPATEPVAQVQTAIETHVEAPAKPVATATNLGGSSIPDQIARLENWLVNINNVRGLV